MKDYLAVIGRGLSEAPAVRVRVGRLVFDAVHEGLKEVGRQTGRWMLWSAHSAFPNLLVCRTPVELHVDLKPEAIIFDRELPK